MQGYCLRSPQAWADVESGKTEHPKLWHVQAYIVTLDLTHEERNSLAKAGGIIPRHPAPASCTEDASAA